MLNDLALAYPVWLAAIPLAICGFALVMTIVNAWACRRSPRDGRPSDATLVSVCVPARNEEANLAECAITLLNNDLNAETENPSNFEIVVYDDGSTDDTPRILEALTQRDPRVVPCPVEPLPQGWNGKQHACWRAANHAIASHPEVDDTHHWLLFTDADVRFTPDCLRRAVAEAERLFAPMVSVFPRQVTKSPAEHALVPMMFFLLFSYLPMPLMAVLRPSQKYASMGAGCGQFLLVRRDAYQASGGHQGFKDSMHDGIRLPRAVRSAGFHTDLFNGTDLCGVRMYRGFAQTWRGFAKNAYEGVGSVGGLIFFTVWHTVGHLLPWLVLLLGLLTRDLSQLVGGLTVGAIGCQIAQRWILAMKHKHSLWAAVLHPVGVLGMTLIQWHSYYLSRTGRRAWRGRVAGAPEG